MIAGLQKMTLLDYPGKVACTVFLQGCNFRCPFCHNSGLLEIGAETSVPWDSLMTFLEKRRGILDGVCITGGEPTIHARLPELIRQIKEKGYSVKLDTNGGNPNMLKQLVSENLLDYVAMDVKNCPARYGETAGVSQVDMGKIQESMEFLIQGDVDYEFRTTVVEELHTPEDMRQMGIFMASLCPEKIVKRLFIQPYTDRDSVLCGGLHTPNRAQLQLFLEAVSPYVHSAEIRGDAL